MAKSEPLKRTIYCGQINEQMVGKTVTVYGWISGIRELGGITFLDLRDREGVLQIVVNETFIDQKLLKELGREFVISVIGTVIMRTNPNPDMFTGKVELLADKIEILSRSEIPPFVPEKRDEVAEELRFKYRYLDLRNQKLQKNFALRSQVNLFIRQYLDKLGFLDIETPFLSKATPEGARDYLVPSRIYKGKMFALPQSPQLFKQLLMVSGFERYYQIVKCFRDEDLRADRQPEFTQVDIEMSFAEPEDLFAIINGLIKKIFAMKGIDVSLPIPILDYAEVMNKYGSDKPDLRIPYEITDFSTWAPVLNSQIINNVINSQGRLKGLAIDDKNQFSRKVFEQVNQFVQQLGGKGIIWLRHTPEGYKASIKIESAAIESFYRENKIDKDKVIFLVADNEEKSLFLAGKLREFLGQEYLKAGLWKFLWVVDFPLFFYNSEEKRLDSNHHPFTAPKSEDIHLLDSAPLQVKSVAYDLVLNGIEIGGGSQRIHDHALQQKIFQLLNLNEKQIEEKFGFFIQALKYGVPPHLGIALGFDRILMLLAGETSIREVIAFPKTTSSLCLLTGSPTSVSADLLDELGIQLKPTE